MLHELLAKYGSLRNIPKEELDAAGYELVNQNGTCIIRQKGTVNGDVRHGFKQRIAKAYEIEYELVPECSNVYYQNLLKIAKSRVREEGKRKEIFGMNHLEPADDEWTLLVRAAAEGRLDAYRRTHQTHLDAEKQFKELGLNFDVWLQGIVPCQTEIQPGEIVPIEVTLKRIQRELEKAFHDFIEKELARPKAGLAEIAQQLKTKADVNQILRRVQGDKEAVRKLVVICERRAARKDALRARQPIALFHLSKIKKSLFEEKKQTKGGLCEVKLARKDPFTDIQIGNDGGACIGIYEKDEEHEGGIGDEQIPNYFLDPMSQFAQITLGKQRCGFALLFAGIDEEEQPVLIVNSYEFNSRQEPIADELVAAMTDWVLAFAQAVGFTETVIGSHDYNTGFTCRKYIQFKATLKKIQKLSAGTGWVHGDVLRDVDDLRVVNVAVLICNRTEKGSHTKNFHGSDYVIWRNKEYGPYNIDEDYQIEILNGKPLFVIKARKSQAVVWGDEIIAESDWVVGISIAAGKALIALYRDGSKKIIWGEFEQTYSDIIGDPLVINSKLVYTAKKQDDECLVQGEVYGPCYHEISYLQEAEGKPLYMVRNNDNEFVVWGRKKSKKYVKVASPSIVKGQMLFRAEKNGMQLMVWGRREFRSYEKVQGITVTEDGKPLYMAMRNGVWFVVCDEQESSSYDEVRELNYALKKPLYAARRGEEWFIVWGEQEGAAYDRVYDLRFANGKPLYRASRQGVWFIIWGEREIVSAGFIEHLKFVENRLLYSILDGTKERLVWGDWKSEPHDEILDANIIDGELIYLVRDEQ